MSFENNEKIDFGILTALALERDAVIKQFNLKKITKSKSVYYKGKIQHKPSSKYFNLILRFGDVGNVESSLATKKLIEDWNPSFIVFLGIAGGIDDNKINYGDILIPKEIVYYTISKDEKNEIERRPSHQYTDPILFENMRNFPSIDEKELLIETIKTSNIQPKILQLLRLDSKDDILPKVHHGPLLSGDTVIKNPNKIRELLKLAPKAIGIEMESWGSIITTFREKNKPGFISIRGVSDLADKPNDELWGKIHDYAANVAASYLKCFLEYGPLIPEKKADEHLIDSNEIKDQYDIVWKNNEDIIPADILKQRSKEIYGFNKFYFERNKIENKLHHAFELRKNILIIGPPLSGKSRMLYEFLKKNKNRLSIIRPRFKDIELDQFLIPPKNNSRKKILLLDDLHKYFAYENFDHLLISFFERNIQIIATCNDEEDLEKVMTSLYINPFNFEKIELKKITKNQAIEIAKKTNKQYLKTEFDGNIGSIFFPLNEIRKRYKQLNNIKKAILTAIKFAYLSGVYEENFRYSINIIKKILHVKDIELNINNYEFQKSIQSLKKKNFITIEDKKIEIQDIYLKKIIDTDYHTLSLVQYENLINLLKEYPRQVRRIGENLTKIGRNHKYLVNFTNLALKGFDLIKDNFTNELDIATLHDRIGSAYQNLSYNHKTIKNLSKAIIHYKTALKHRNLKNAPIKYAGTQNNLANCYRKLSKMKKNQNYIKLSIEAFAESLNVFTLTDFPIYYAYIQINLSSVFINIVNISSRYEFSILGFEALLNSFLIINKERFQEEYVTAKANLAIINRYFGNFFNKPSYYEKSIKNSKEALKYIDTQSTLLEIIIKENLANTYCIYAEKTNYNHKMELYLKSFEIYDEILSDNLKSYSLNRYHNVLLNNTSSIISYMNQTGDLNRFKEVSDKLKNLLNYYFEEKDDISCARVYYNIGRLNHLCSLASPINEDFCKKAYSNYLNALEIFKKEKLPKKITEINGKIDNLIKICNNKFSKKEFK